MANIARLLSDALMLDRSAAPDDGAVADAAVHSVGDGVVPDLRAAMALRAPCARLSGDHAMGERARGRRSLRSDMLLMAKRARLIAERGMKPDRHGRSIARWSPGRELPMAPRPKTPRPRCPHKRHMAIEASGEPFPLRRSIMSPHQPDQHALGARLSPSQHESGDRERDDDRERRKRKRLLQHMPHEPHRGPSLHEITLAATAQPLLIHPPARA